MSKGLLVGVGCGAIILALPGCGLQEIRNRTAFGPEYQHKGTSSTNEVRWAIEQGIQLKWQKDVTTGVTYRRRDIDDGNGDNENRVMFDVSFPLWKAKDKKEETLARRVEQLERRLAALEASMNEEVQ
jgi:hypothetical protein